MPQQQVAASSGSYAPCLNQTTFVNNLATFLIGGTAIARLTGNGRRIASSVSVECGCRYMNPVALVRIRVLIGVESVHVLSRPREPTIGSVRAWAIGN